MIMNRRLLILPASLLLLACGCLGGCGGERAAGQTTSGQKVEIVASTDVYGDIAKQIGGSGVTVKSILTNPDQDPHSFEADPRTTLAISKAEVLIENGGGYDDYMDALRKAHNASAPVLNVVDISGKAAPPGGVLNEHVFYDLPSVQKFADALAVELGKQDATHASDYQARAKTFDDKIGNLIAEEAALRPALRGKAIGITEPVPLYMTEALGLTNATPPEFSEAIEEGGDVAPRVLQNTLALYSGGKVGALVYNEQTSGPITEKVKAAAQAADIAVVGVTETLPAGKDYLGWMGDNIKAVAAAFGAS
jgi:zinc/manganese transport system substrate-binding protein